MSDNRMYWGAGALVVLSTLATGCAHRPAAIGEGTTLAQVCDRARSEAEANAVRETGNRQAWRVARVASQVAYDVAGAKEWSNGARHPSLPRRFDRDPGFTIRENRAAEECRLARQREREAQLEAQETILTPSL